MPTPTPNEPVSGPALWSGRLLSGLVILFLLFDGAIKLVPWPIVTETMDRIGYGSSETLARALGAVTIACTVLYAIPPTSILGAILLTGYLGGAIAITCSDRQPSVHARLVRILSGADDLGRALVARPEAARPDAIAGLIRIAGVSSVTEFMNVRSHRLHCHHPRDRHCACADPCCGKAGYVPRHARRGGQGRAGDDLSADRRLPRVEQMVTLGRPRSRAEADVQRCRTRQGRGLCAGTATGMSARAAWKSPERLHRRTS